MEAALSISPPRSTIVAMPPPRLPRLRENRLVVMLLADEKRLVEKRARDLGLPLSLFARAVLLANCNESRLGACPSAEAELEAAPGMPPSRVRLVP